jgi:geranylgeranyl diphosphate synthase type I
VIGKRIRPTLTLLTCAGAGGDPAGALPAAAAVELLHNFTLIHDNIQDDSPTRRGRPTVWRMWGRAQAINAGDALFTLAHLAMHRLTGRGHPAAVTLEALRLLDETCLSLTRGQHLDMAFEDRASVSVDEYWQMIEGKTAALLAASAELGAVCAGAPPETLAAYRGFGRCLGLAFQTQDDLLGIWGDSAVTGKSSATDIEARKKSLPILYGLERDEYLRRAYAAPESDGGGNTLDIIRALEGTGARAYAEQQAGRWSQAALDQLASARPGPPAAEALHTLTTELLNRSR